MLSVGVCCETCTACCGRRQLIVTKYFKNGDSKHKADERCMQSNPRRMPHIVRGYAKGILEEGVQALARGASIVVQGNNEDNCVEYRIVAGASLVEALFLAHSMEPENEFVTMVNQDCFPAFVFKLDTPRGVLKCVKSAHNRFHFGASISLVEQSEEMLDHEAKWKGHCKQNSIDKHSCLNKGLRTWD